MFGDDLALFILLYKLDADFSYYLNSKIFVKECLAVLYSAIAVIFCDLDHDVFGRQKLNEKRAQIDK